MTNDADFAIAVADWNEFAQAREALLAQGARLDVIIGRLDSILSRELAAGSQGTLALQLNPVEPDRALKLLAAFCAGLLGASQP